MKLTGVQKLAHVLRVMVIVVFVCNILALVLVPGMVAFHQIHIPAANAVRNVTVGGDFIFEPAPPGVFVFLYSMVFLQGFETVWQEAYTAVLTVFLWVCGICTAVILWQARRVLDTILAQETFTFGNAANMKRAAVCCFVISGAALARTVWGLFYYRSIAPLLTYNFLFVPLFLMAGLVCMVMSALFRQAAEMKAENDLTI